jgi:hypothetical protein
MRVRDRSSDCAIGSSARRYAAELVDGRLVVVDQEDRCGSWQVALGRPMDRLRQNYTIDSGGVRVRFWERVG